MLVLLTLCSRSRKISEGGGEGVQASHLLENLNKVQNLSLERTVVVFFCSRIELHEQPLVIYLFSSTCYGFIIL